VDPGVAEVGLGGDVDIRRPVRAAGDSAVLARVDDPPGAGGDRGFDGSAVQADHIGGRVVAGHQQDLLGTGERVTQRGRVLVGGLPHTHTTVGEVLRPGGVADTDTDPVGGYVLEEVLDGGPTQPTGGAGDNDHVLDLPE